MNTSSWHLIFAVTFALFASLSLASPARADGAIGEEVRQAPRVLLPGSLGVGRQIPDFRIEDIQGRAFQLSDFADKQAIVIAMTDVGCPLCKKYAPTLADLEKRYANRNVAFLFLNPNESESIEQLREEVSAKGFSGPYIRDDQEHVTRLLDVKTTTEVFVLDRARTLVYRGAVDDQYGFGYSLDAPRKTYLVDALEAVLADRLPNPSVTTSPGCEMFYSDRDQEPSLESQKVTYHNRISRIIQRHCLECHRDGSVAPMPLESYEQVRDYAGMIRSVVQRGVMPPWFAAPLAEQTDQDAVHSLWANDRSLSKSEKDDLYRWAEEGAPEGDAADAPSPRVFPAGWLIGQPDAVFEFPQPVPIKATGILPYKQVIVDTDLPEDKWVQSIEIVPGDAGVVHHVLVFVLAPGKAERGGGVDYWGIYVPGNSTQVYPEGYARLLPKGSRLKFQMHYTTNGTATEDRTKIGLKFADQLPQYEVKTASIVDRRFKIPPGASNHRVEASLTVPSDVEILGLLPHHHLRGKACRYDLKTPDGKTETLLDVPRYDFNWQLLYQYAQPKPVSKGSRIDFTAWYDNSAGNPANPDPTITVRWGEQTNDEMHLGYVEYIVPSESLAARQEVASGDDDRDSAPLGGLFTRLDADGDGRVTRAEVQERMPERATMALRIFERLDVNNDGSLDRKEMSRLSDR